MTVIYFKRHKMELHLDDCALDDRELPDCVHLLPWSRKLLNRHAAVKWQSFREELDAHVFPCLGELEGCRQLMKEITSRKNFVPQATWLACRESDFAPHLEPCGTIQGLRASGTRRGDTEPGRSCRMP